MKHLLFALLAAFACLAPAADLTVAEIRAQLEADPSYAILTEQVNGQTVTLSAEQRAAVLDRWASARHAAQTPPVPAAVSRRQLRLELLSRGLLANVTAALNGISDEATKAAALIEWEDATTFDRAHPLVGQIGAALGLTSAQLDDIWRAAAARTFTPTAP